MATKNVPCVYARYIFFVHFLEKNHEKIHFRRYFRALSPWRINAISYFEPFRMCTGFIECMRCDRLASVIFRASGSKFRVTVRASAREIPHTTASRHRAAKNAKRAACCLLLRVDRGISKDPATASRIAPYRCLHRFRFAALSAPDTLHNATASPARNLDHHHRTKSRLHDNTTDLRPPTA